MRIPLDIDSGSRSRTLYFSTSQILKTQVSHLSNIVDPTCDPDTTLLPLSSRSVENVQRMATVVVDGLPSCVLSPLSPLSRSCFAVRSRGAQDMHIITRKHRRYCCERAYVSALNGNSCYKTVRLCVLNEGCDVKNWKKETRKKHKCELQNKFCERFEAQRTKHLCPTPVCR